MPRSQRVCILHALVADGRWELFIVVFWRLGVDVHVFLRLGVDVHVFLRLEVYVHVFLRLEVKGFAYCMHVWLMGPGSCSWCGYGDVLAHRARLTRTMGRASCVI